MYDQICAGNVYDYALLLNDTPHYTSIQQNVRQNRCHLISIIGSRRKLTVAVRASTNVLINSRDSSETDRAGLSLSEALKDPGETHQENPF